MAIAMGDTDKERQQYANGYRMGYFLAVRTLREAAERDKEEVGVCSAGPFTKTANYLEVRMPKGSVVTTHEVK